MRRQCPISSVNGMNITSWQRRLGAAAISLVCAGTLLAQPIAASATPPADQKVQVQDHSPGRHDRGTIVSATPILDLDSGETRRMLSETGYPTSQARYGVTGYRLLYRTVDHRGRPTTASGLVAFPDAPRRFLRQVAFLHGTSPSKQETPSTGFGDDHQAGALSFAAAGYATVAPDYLGLGTGPGRPVYLDSRTEATATIDLLRAAQRFAPRTGHRLERDVHLAGFSQGAHAVLAVGRALEQGHGRHGLRLAAMAPISGPYDPHGSVLPAMLDGTVDPRIATFYIGYLLTSWNAIHRLYDSPDQLFAPEYAPVIEGLFDGTHPSQEIFQRLPGTLDELLTPAGMDQLRHPTGRFARALSDYASSCSGWTPRAPTRMYYASGDREVVNANTEACVADFARSGYRMRTADLGDVDHIRSGRLGAEAAVRWFDSLNPGDETNPHRRRSAVLGYRQNG